MIQCLSHLFSVGLFVLLTLCILTMSLFSCVSILYIYLHTVVLYKYTGTEMKGYSTFFGWIENRIQWRNMSCDHFITATPINSTELTTVEGDTFSFHTYPLFLLKLTYNKYSSVIWVIFSRTTPYPFFFFINENTARFLKP